MSNKIACPACGQEILGERFMAPTHSRAVWYRFEGQPYQCPRCRVALGYDRRTRVLLVVVGGLVAIFMGLVILDFLPVVTIFIVPQILYWWFFRVRRLVVKNAHNKRLWFNRS